MTQPEPETELHTLHLEVRGSNADAVGSACADIDAFLVESEAVDAWTDATVTWVWRP